MTSRTVSFASYGMTPWFTMPSDADARKKAALEELNTVIAVLSRVAVRIADAPVSARERRLLRTMTSELARARRAVRILGRG